MSKMIDESLMDNTEEVVELVSGEVALKEMQLIVEYCKHYDFKKTTTDIEKLDLDARCELLMAANYFNIPAIFELCCAAIAAFFKGKDFDKIKGDFGLQDVTYTPEDEEKLKAEYPWIQEQAEKKIAEIQAEIEKKAAAK